MTALNKPSMVSVFPCEIAFVRGRIAARRTGTTERIWPSNPICETCVTVLARAARLRQDRSTLGKETPMAFTLTVNGERRTADVDGDTPLLWVLRDTLGLVGAKFGCGAALCGACTVHLDGAPIRACVTPISEIGAKKVTTIEGIGKTPVGAKVQEAWKTI